MDEKDLLLLTHLRQDSRKKLTAISKETQIPVSTIFEKLKNMKTGPIKGFTSIINFPEAGYHSMATVMIGVKKTQKQDLLKYLLKNPNINKIQKINNGYDFQLEIINQHIKDFEDLIDDIELNFKITKKQVNYVIEDITRETFLSNPLTA